MENTTRQLRLEPTDDHGFAVWEGSSLVGYVFPDSFTGWRPYSIQGRCRSSGRPAHATPIQAAYAEL